MIQKYSNDIIINKEEHIISNISNLDYENLKRNKSEYKVENYISNLCKLELTEEEKLKYNINSKINDIKLFKYMIDFLKKKIIKENGTKELNLIAYNHIIANNNCNNKKHLENNKKLIKYYKDNNFILNNDLYKLVCPNNINPTKSKFILGFAPVLVLKFNDELQDLQLSKKKYPTNEELLEDMYKNFKKNDNKNYQFIKNKHSLLHDHDIPINLIEIDKIDLYISNSTIAGATNSDNINLNILIEYLYYNLGINTIMNVSRNKNDTDIKDIAEQKNIEYNLYSFGDSGIYNTFIIDNKSFDDYFSIPNKETIKQNYDIPSFTTKDYKKYITENIDTLNKYNSENQARIDANRINLNKISEKDFFVDFIIRNKENSKKLINEMNTIIIQEKYEDTIKTILNVINDIDIYKKISR